MYAIVFFSGKQYKVQKGETILVNRIKAKQNDILTIKNVLFIKKNEEVMIGRPYIEGASVIAEVVNHTKGPKLIIFKKKPKKHYKKKIGHRQLLTELKIKDIILE